jgi:hypothetical protein
MGISEESTAKNVHKGAQINRGENTKVGYL